jgi:phage protein D
MSDLGGTPGFYASRPVLKIDGEQPPGLNEGLLGLSVEETTAGLFNCEACFGNWGSTGGDVGFLYFDRAVLDFGRTLTVEMGEGGTRAPVFEGRITAVEARYPRKLPPEIQVLAEDRCQDLRMVRRTRTFEDVTDQEVFEEIAREHGLQPEIDIEGPSYRTLAQVNQSDLAFLRDRARAIDAEVWVEGGQMFAQASTRRRAATPVTLTYGKGLRELNASADLAHQRTRLAIGGWDVEAKEAIEEEVDAGVVAQELNGGLSGGSVLQEAFGDRPERLVHSVPLTSDEGLAVAEARYRSIARRFLAADGVAEGDARIKVATILTLRGLGPFFDGPWYVTSVRHTFEPKGAFLTRFRCHRPGLGAT